MGSTSPNDGGILRPLAVVGMSYRFPGESTSDEAFWNMLLSKRCASTDIPPTATISTLTTTQTPSVLIRLPAAEVTLLKAELYVDVFDAGFFGIGATESSSMDPLHRISLEESFRAFENAGLSLEDVAGTKTCVFSGCLSPDYVTVSHKDTYNPNQYHASGLAINMLANRVIWWFDLRGPSVTVDTACSSSLIALNLACQSIWAGDATMGLVCGANMLLTPESQLYLNNLGLLSEDSRSYSFDHCANGYGCGEGVGVIIVQPLDEAIRHGRTIRAVIRSSCSNQDGKTPGITAPSQEAHFRLINDTYLKAGLNMEHTRYFEAHGTDHRGSVKTNIGHLEGGSGVAGVIKAILALEHGVIPPNANFERLNPDIDADSLKIKIVADAVPWPPGLRRASVQSFGFGGANSHVVLDDAYNFMRLHGLQGNHKTKPVPGLDDLSSTTPNDMNTFAPKILRLLVWSTADEGGIARTKDDWREFLGLVNPTQLSKGRDFLGDVAYTLGARRTHFTWRAMSVVDSMENLAGVADSMSAPTCAAASPQLGLVFTGQGSQWYAMGRELITHYALYKQSLLDAGVYLASLGCSWNPIAELLRSETESNVNEPLYGSLCTIVQVALVELLRSFDVQSTAVVGHSSGEIAAAFCAGAIPRESAWKIAYYRGIGASLLAEKSEIKGSMMAVGMAKDKVQSYVDQASSLLGECRLTIAWVNSPRNVTISGEDIHIDHLKGLLDADKVFCRKLRVGVAYHYPHYPQMQEIVDKYHERMGFLGYPASDEEQPHQPGLISSVTGTWIASEAMAKPEYWIRNLISPVLFSDALATMAHSVNTLLEVGPHSALQAPVREILRDIDVESTTTYVPLLSRGVSAVKSLLAAMGRLHCLGHPLALDYVNMNPLDSMVTITNLPRYNFNHSRGYWHESRASRGYRLRQHPVFPHVGAPEADFNPLEAKWRKIIRISDLPWVQDHKINGTILYPAAGMIVMAIEAAQQLADHDKIISAFVVRNVALHSALNLPSNAPTVGIEVNLFMRPRQDQDGKNAGWFDFRLCTHDDNSRVWYENCHGAIQLVYEADRNDRSHAKGIDNGHEERLWRASLCREYHEMAAACSTTMEKEEFYKRLANWGFNYGPAFRDMTAVASDGHGGAVIEVKTFEPPDGSAHAEHIVHPATLDCIFQLIIVAITNAGSSKLGTGIPTHFDRIWVSATGVSYPHARSLKAYGRAKRLGLRQTETSIGVLDSSGTQAVIKIDGFVATDVSSSTGDAADKTLSSSAPLCHTIEWKPDLDTLTGAQFQHLFTNKNDLPLHSETPYNDLDKWSPTPAVAHFGLILDSIVHKSPNARILQVGAGSGDEMDRLMNILAPDGVPPRFGLFDYTHAESELLDAAQEKLDISASPEEQGFEAGDYDVVVITVDLYTNTNLAKALNHCCALLKPGGKLVIFHPTYLDVKDGQGNLGFFNAASYKFRIIICTAAELTPSLAQPPLTAAVVRIIHGPEHRKLALELQRFMTNVQCSARVQGLDEVAEEAEAYEDICVFLLELGQPVWYDIARETFVRIQKLLSTTRKSLWVQRGVESLPHFRLIDGVSRVLNSERDRAALTLLRLEGNDDALTIPQMGHIVRLCRQFLSSDDVDTEYVEREGMLHIPRLVPRPQLNAQIETRLRPRQHVTRPWYGEGQVPLLLAIGSPGLLNTVHWVEDTENTPDAPLGDTEVEVRVHSVGLSFRDLLMLLGRVNHSGIGNDIAGVVTRLGRGCSGLRVGDRVAACRMNAYRSLVRCPRTHVVTLPDNMSLSEGASLPMPFVTAWQCLKERAFLRAGETVLIHSAAGGTGQAAVQVAQYLGANIIATVGTDEKRELVVERYGLPPDHVLSSRDTSFFQGVMRLTSGRGVDVVLNSLSGEGLFASWECVAPFGCFIEIGKKDIIAKGSLSMAQFAHNVSFSAYDLSEMLLDRAGDAGAALQQILTLIEQKKMSPVHPLQVFSAGEIEKAFRAMQSGKTMGKIVVEFRPDEQVEAFIGAKSTLSLDSDAAYVIAGGLGGLGRAICQWFVHRGARNLILLTRSAVPKTSEAKELLFKLRSQGAQIVVKACDISYSNAVAAALLASPGTPIIKGCIQASAVLRDAAFEAMSFDAWQDSLASKVAGTWNLHRAMPQGIDFFIMLSSVASTCGSRGQANYAAGNTFQNAVAHYRVAAGERATALALGPFFDVGMMTENDFLQNQFAGVSGVAETELLALLDYYCDKSKPADPNDCEPTVMRFAPGMENSKLNYVLRKPMFRGIKAAMMTDDASQVANGAPGEHGGLDFARFFAAKPTAAEAVTAVGYALATKLAETMVMSRDEIDMTAPMRSFGVDSLVAVEIRNWMSNDLRADVAIFDILEATSVVALGALAIGKSSYFAEKNDSVELHGHEENCG
ncbi:hypothetical protein BU24DRAFT_452003 [Aaosphaeria arxii CBS 175.79]|uniref:Uncharacterized protein n=1 Tax=Aaosphaeria arxii CBS 175.79 TaxID=1450172 RepID=A0A6A5XQB2_9PLEO|nr:uncharacterized protein BU24DRAFT_452003 [Aaosphaeria arxii CBS 175.79]KAF2015123.1 hypothetical protein BU24DRAFT_452003 [Aaosphaeria arxii CBS 175.79]